MQHLKYILLLLFCYPKTVCVISLSNMRFVGSKTNVFHGSQQQLSPQVFPVVPSLGWMMLQSWHTFLDLGIVLHKTQAEQKRFMFPS